MVTIESLSQEMYYKLPCLSHGRTLSIPAPVKPLSIPEAPCTVAALLWFVNQIPPIVYDDLKFVVRSVNVSSVHVRRRTGLQCPLVVTAESSRGTRPTSPALPSTRTSASAVLLWRRTSASALACRASTSCCDLCTACTCRCARLHLGRCGALTCTNWLVSSTKSLLSCVRWHQDPNGRVR